jgi:protein TonB
MNSAPGISRFRWTGLLVVLLLHLGALKFLIDYRFLLPRQELPSISVDLIVPRPPAPPSVEPLKPPRPRPQAEPKPASRPLAIETQVSTPADYVAPDPPKRAEPVQSPPPAPQPVATAPLRLGTELALACPERRAPVYPSVSRRLGETGQVLLRVELDPEGRVAATSVEKSSGYARLDEAALAAVKTWRCQPPLRDGRPARAIALQPFNFLLEGV